MYLSTHVQNELIRIRGEEVLQQVVKRISTAKYFSILADETTDASNVEQMCLLVRYVDHEKHCIREDLITHADVTDDLNVSGLATAILDAVA